MDEDEKLIKRLREEIKGLEWRLMAVEKEQRRIREDILSGDAVERMKRRLLNNHPDNINEVKKKIDKQIEIEI